jgi:hypothetical protein
MSGTNQETKKLSNTNTDALCCEEGFFSRALYRYNLWTGLYMLEQHERIFFHIFGCFYSRYFYMLVSSQKAFSMDFEATRRSILENQ